MLRKNCFEKDVLCLQSGLQDYILVFLSLSLFNEPRKKRRPDLVATQSERPPVTQLNLMSFEKIQSGQTDEIQ